MGRRFKGPHDPLKLTRVSVRQVRVFMKYIAKHDLWNELEQSLNQKGIHDLLVSVHPIHAIQDHIETSLKGNKKNKSGRQVSQSEHM